MRKIEYIDIVDKNNKEIGITDVETAHELKLHHRVVGIFIFSLNGDLYLQKSRKYEKYDNSVGGHVKAGECEDCAAKRELMEEIGVKVPLNKLVTFFPEKSNLGHVWTLYEGVLPKNWEFKGTEEVEILERKKIEEWLKLINKFPEKFTQGLKNTMLEYVKVNNLKN